MTRPIRTRHLTQLPLRRDTLEHLRDVFLRGQVDGAVVYFDGTPDQNVKVHAWGPSCVDKTEARVLRAIPVEPAYVWAPRDQDAGSEAPRVKPGSRTARALELLAAGEAPNVNAAAREAGVDAAAVYRARNRGTRTVCPHCGKPA